MILFDIVVHNPEHPETTLSLALLDIAGGHFSRIEFASRGTLPGSLLAQFAHLARQYVVDQRHRKRRGSNITLRLPKGQPESQDAVQRMPTEFSNLPAPGIVTPDPPGEQMLAMSHEVLLEPTSTPSWNINALDGSEQLFIPLIDDPSYRIEDLELLGIDLKDLFDFPYALPGTENGV